MAKFLEKVEIIKYTLAAAVTYGKAIQVGSLAGVALEAGASGDEISVAIDGVFLIETDASSVTVGAEVFLSSAGKILTATATGAISAGHAVGAVSGGFVPVKLNV